MMFQVGSSRSFPREARFRWMLLPRLRVVIVGATDGIDDLGNGIARQTLHSGVRVVDDEIGLLKRVCFPADNLNTKCVRQWPLRYGKVWKKIAGPTGLTVSVSGSVMQSLVNV